MVINDRIKKGKQTFRAKFNFKPHKYILEIKNVFREIKIELLFQNQFFKKN